MEEAKAREKELRRIQSGGDEQLVASVPLLLAALDDPEGSVRWTAVEVLGRLPEEELIKLFPMVQERLADADIARREAATQVNILPQRGSCHLAGNNPRWHGCFGSWQASCEGRT